MFFPDMWKLCERASTSGYVKHSRERESPPGYVKYSCEIASPPPPPEEQLPREVYGSSDRYATGQVLCEVLTNFMDNGAMLRSSHHRQERRP